MECKYCFNSLEEDAQECPRCGVATESAAAPSGGEMAQSQAPISYSPGGPTGDIGIHSTCPGCGESMGGQPHCPTCGYSGVEHDETWSDFITLDDAQVAAVGISRAVLAEGDDETLARLASSLVWGTPIPELSEDGDDETEVDTDDAEYEFNPDDFVPSEDAEATPEQETSEVDQ